MNHIFGTGLSKAHYEVLMLKITPAYRDSEPEMYERKWFDYRTMHPTEATYVWAHAYNEESKAHYSRIKDTGTAFMVRGIAEIDAMKSAEANAIWWARHSCDYIGCPYDLAVRYLADRAVNNGHTGMPRPNQLYTMDCLIDLAAWWKERVATQLTYSNADFFSAQRFEEHPAQIQHVEFVAKQIAARANPRHRLVARLIKEGVLDERLAHRFFPQEAKQALDYFAAYMTK